LLFSLVVPTPAHTETNFIGFRTGQNGFGVMGGWPTLNLRYQAWTNWKRAWFYNFALDSEGFVVLSFDRAFYFYDVKDQWRVTGAWSSAFFYTYLGGMYGQSIVSGLESRLGVEGGLGIEYVLPNPEWTARVELGTSLHATGKDAAALHLGIGATYYFDIGEGRRFKSKREDVFQQEDKASDESASKSDDIDFDDFSDENVISEKVKTKKAKLKKSSKRNKKQKSKLQESED
jgi:hypothetical protein